MILSWYRKVKEKPNLFVAVTSLIGWIALGTIVFRKLEGWTLIQSFYFSVVTITTVGFGDLTPSTEVSRLCTAIYILVGVSIGLVTLSSIGSEFIQEREKKWIEKNRK